MAKAKAKGKTVVAQDSGMAEADLKTLLSAASACFSYMAGDLLQACAEAGQSYISRAEAMECVIDANRLEDHLTRVTKRPDLANGVRLILDSEGGYEKMQKILRPAFPHARYS